MSVQLSPDKVISKQVWVIPESVPGGLDRIDLFIGICVAFLQIFQRQTGDSEFQQLGAQAGGSDAMTDVYEGYFGVPRLEI